MHVCVKSCKISVWVMLSACVDHAEMWPSMRQRIDVVVTTCWAVVSVRLVVFLQLKKMVWIILLVCIYVCIYIFDHRG